MPCAQWRPAATAIPPALAAERGEDGAGTSANRSRAGHRRPGRFSGIVRASALPAGGLYSGGMHEVEEPFPLIFLVDVAAGGVQQLVEGDLADDPAVFCPVYNGRACDIVPSECVDHFS